ncbi:MAG TPA: BTAD domain-containing putative transcriptional regulator [Pseudonocardiaceae bacterium]|nr:BTAD domain-containing putative transcriptional regulator [Pseudonocardiaceae bacterium]
MRRVLPAELIGFRDGGYVVDVDPDLVDVHRFERLAGHGARLVRARDYPAAATTLREALGLWRGDPLVDLPFRGGLVARLEELRIVAFEDLAEAELSLPGGADIGRLRELVDQFPLRERLRGLLMRALHNSGRQADALSEFEDVRRLLADELGADPSTELAGVHLSILRADQPDRIRPPAQLTSFVGRGAELARLAGLRGARLVTLLGPGGVGKTRLAVEFAPDACFVDLSNVDVIADSLLHSLGLREAGDPVVRLVTALRDEDVLLLLDNCEHVVAGVASLVRVLLAECPRVRVLATSREALGLTGEVLVPVASLADDAATLFLERAATVRSGFAADRDTVAAVCASLDGLPLAIELAAARVRQFSVDEIAARLGEGRFTLLSRGDRTAAERHRTLRAVVAWSWELLSPDEQQLAARCSVFSGGAPLDAVERICDADSELLADLVDKSLVETDGTRYRMLETIRLWCAEQLGDETSDLRRQHARYHLELAQRADPHLRRAEQLDWLATLSTEHDNLMAALRWSVHYDRETAFGLVAALAAYWWLTGRRSQAGAAAAALLDDVPAGIDEEYVSCVVHAVPRAAPEHWERADRILRTFDRPLRYPFGIALWGMAAGPPEDEPNADSLLTTDPWNVALGQLSAGLLTVLGGRSGAGERALTDALTRFRTLGERWGTSQALDWLAQVASWRGEWPRAHTLWAEGLALQEELGASQECVDLLCHRASSAIREGDLDAAAADLRRAAEFAAKAGPDASPAVLLGSGMLDRARGGDGRAPFEEVLGAADGFATAAVKARALAALGRHDEALAVDRAQLMAADVANLAEGQADAALAGGDRERAATLLGAAVALRGLAVAGDADVARVAAGAREFDGFAAAYARGAAMTHDEAMSAIYG